MQEPAQAGRGTRQTRGHKISHTVVGELLKKQKFSLQANSKTREGADNPDRDAQFHVVNDAVKTRAHSREPASYLRRYEEEGTGRRFKNTGREWRKQGNPEEVRVHDFLIKQLGRAVPYGFRSGRQRRAGSVWGSTMTRPPSRFRRSARWARPSAHVHYPLARRLVDHRRWRWIERLARALWKLDCSASSD